MLALVVVGGGAAFFLYRRMTGDNVDVSTWPQAPSDAVLRVAQAIAIAEGSPASWNNPGDLTGGDAYGFELQRDGDGDALVNSAGVVRFVNLADGVNALYRKLQRIQNGASRVYSSAMSLVDFAQEYTGGDNAGSWAKNVAAYLGLDVGSSVGDLFGGGQ